MNWPDQYQRIVAEFGFDQAADAESARQLAQLHPHAAPPRLLLDVTVLGCGPSLERAELSSLKGTVVAADGATTRLRELEVFPDIVVTDLDGEMADLNWAAQNGALMVVHAHGDNQERLEETAGWPLVHPTCQSPAGPGLANYGGFTDGDRALFLCRAWGAKSVRLIGFDFDAPPSKYSHVWGANKARKLAWAKRLAEEALRGLTVQYLA